MRRFQDQKRVLWLPLGGIAVGWGLAQGALALDGAVAVEEVPGLLRWTAENARTVLGAIVGALVTVTAVIFWLWMVTIQLATENASTRIIRQHLNSRFQEVAVTFIAANFTYNAAVLRVLPDAEDPTALADTPHLATGLAVTLTAFTVVVILNAVNQAARRTQVGSLSRRIRERTVERIQDLPAGEILDGDPAAHGELVRADVSGWVAEPDVAALAATLPTGGAARLEVRPNTFVLAGAPLATVWPSADHDRVRAAVPLAEQASIAYDPDHGVRQLVEMAEQSLPPGSGNTLALHDVLSNLVVTLRELATHLPEGRDRRVDGRTVRCPHYLCWEDYLHLAVDRLCELGCNDAELTEAMTRELSMLADQLSHERAALVRATVADVHDRFEASEPGRWARDRVRAAAGAG